MGVKQLWELLSICGRRVSIESLAGKVLAVDMSIWLVQFIKAMREEDGKVVKNAHLIGTLRRILKLLFHRIRPIFVFDGETPAIKQQTIKSRRKFRERQEENYQKAAQNILLNQIKQAALAAKLKSVHSEAEGEGGDTSQYTKSFRPLPASNSNSSTPAEESKVLNEEVKEDSDIEWEDGLKSTGPSKVIHDDDEDASNGEEDYHWDIPDGDELDVEALSHVPAHLRKGIIEEARKKERQRRRSDYFPVSKNPVLYSQTQLVNFLRTSKLNQRIEDVQRHIDGRKDGRTIASQVTIEYYRRIIESFHVISSCIYHPK